MKQVNITLELDPIQKKIVLQSLFPELDRAVPRTVVKLKETEVGLIFTINADDTSALRAALNSYLRWINCIISTTDTFGGKRQVK